ncbi:DctP family TRAP transporter solute-binding subunit [Ectobacillus antri]|uniref:DctP family TRAP transporter solute-binding subunit n=1 Tax=Ectobacillus antri TaxID=2486280 RepID=A0ABT6H5A1_9BACI|nr:DctP family TRAP transporter solute-binding subunit [Ectobacillus antri]MDG4657367.1 DctP family TRAP transporter solute-binding subunit [Ectobacillus antri]MDG5754502.1 DctP family TRAP transporter solute-binding subunit [Ectobacillus antri]
MKHIILLCTLCLLISCSTRAIDYEQVSPKEKLILRFPHVTGEYTPKGLAAKRLKELVESRSNGKIEIQVFPNASLFADEEELSKLQEGSVEIIAPHTAKFSHIVKEAELFNLPYLFTEKQQVWDTVDGPVGAELKRLFAKQGYTLLAIWDNGFKQITNNKHMIRTPAHFKNLHFRIVDSAVIEKQFALVGATTSVLAFDELYAALERGTVQGEENTMSNINNKKLYKQQAYLTKSDHGYLGYFVVANQNFWDRLPEDTKNLLTTAINEVTVWERELAKQMEIEQYEHIKAQQIDIYELTVAEKEQWKKAFKDTYEHVSTQTSSNIIRNYVNEKAGPYKPGT